MYIVFAKTNGKHVNLAYYDTFGEADAVVDLLKHNLAVQNKIALLRDTPQDPATFAIDLVTRNDDLGIPGDSKESIDRAYAEELKKAHEDVIHGL